MSSCLLKRPVAYYLALTVEQFNTLTWGQVAEMEQKKTRKFERKIQRCFSGLTLKNTTAMLMGCERKETLAIELEYDLRNYFSSKTSTGNSENSQRQKKDST